MSEKPSTQGKQEQSTTSQGQQPLTWGAISKLSKQEYLARRDEIRVWREKHIVCGRVID